MSQKLIQIKPGVSNGPLTVTIMEVAPFSSVPPTLKTASPVGATLASGISKYLRVAIADSTDAKQAIVFKEEYFPLFKQNKVITILRSSIGEDGVLSIGRDSKIYE